MQSLQQKASEWSGVSEQDAFAIDEVNLYQRLGHQTFVALSTEFYNRYPVICKGAIVSILIRVYEDDQEWFRSIFGNSRKEDAIQNQYEFFIQRMGGPSLYSQRKGHPALIGRHRPFPVTREAATRWLQHMQKALDAIPTIDSDSKVRMFNFFRHTAFFLVAGNEMMKSQQTDCQNVRHRP